MEAFIKAQPQARDLAFAVGVIANLSSGEILAAPEVNHRYADAPSSVLRSVNVGSAIKPLLAAATLASFPELASLQIRNAGGRATELWGYPLSSDFETGPKCPVGWIDLRRFLECSSNVYAASLVSAGLQARSSRRVALEDRPGAAFRLNAREESSRQPRLPLEARSRDSSRVALRQRPFARARRPLRHHRRRSRRSAWTRETRRCGRDLPTPPATRSGCRPVFGPNARGGLVVQGRRSTLRQLAAVAIGSG